MFAHLVNNGNQLFLWPLIRSAAIVFFSYTSPLARKHVCCNYFYMSEDSDGLKMHSDGVQIFMVQIIQLYCRSSFIP